MNNTHSLFLLRSNFLYAMLFLLEQIYLFFIYPYMSIVYIDHYKANIGAVVPHAKFDLGQKRDKNGTDLSRGA